ncbi:EF-hand domain-containing protein [Hydromonas duriensis]|uniref:EF hand domain-containing protein n=1 Tax=Hydromonas duriensis TaxID=1527608 RepID=A0A4R6Y793_9BURK|nr:EF-hand domain-containing protein [Hydromonas duriensis]TDR31184.1 EF hand domain-containing protein [Hydromonas duriensis]
MKTVLTPKHGFAALLASMALVSTNTFAATFADADKDGDGALTLSELKAAGMDEYAANFKNLDTDKDGKISKAEFKANR